MIAYFFGWTLVLFLNMALSALIIIATKEPCKKSLNSQNGPWLSVLNHWTPFKLMPAYSLPIVSLGPLPNPPKHGRMTLIFKPANDPVMIQIKGKSREARR